MAEWTVLGAFGKFIKSDCQLRHVCLPVRMELLGLHWTDFYKIWYEFFFFWKIRRKDSSFMKSDKKTGTLLKNTKISLHF